MALTSELKAYYEQFFVLGEGPTPDALRVRAVGELDRPEALTRAEEPPDRPIRLEHDEGTQPVDFMGTTWAGLALVSDRFVASLRERDLTGWRTYQVEVFDAVGEALPG